MHFYKRVIEFCKELNIPVSPAFIKARLKSHPDYPNLSSLTDTLDELEIPYAAFISDKQNYASLQYPMFIHINTKEEEYFTVVKSKKVFDNNKNNILENWDGTTIIIEKQKPEKNGIHSKWWEKYTKENKIEFFLILSCAILLLSLFLYKGSLYTNIFLTLSSLGLVTCFSLFKLEIGLDSFVSKTLCSTDKGCSKTLSKENNNILSKLPLADIGIIFFTFQIMFGLINMISENTIVSIYPLIYLTITASLFVIPSIYVQAFILKSWCKMCLLVLGILVLQGLLGYMMIMDGTISIDRPVQNISISLLLISLAIFSWLRIKTVLVESYKALENYIDFQKWKRDPFIFFSLLYNQRKLSDRSSGFAMKMGKANPKLLITMACSPFCNPCAATHKVLHKLLAINKDIQVEIKFAFSKQNLDPKTEKAMKLLLSAYKVAGGNALHEWFSQVDVERFENKYPYNESFEEEYTNALLDCAQWSAENNIRHTPTLFLNGYQMPQQYNPDDLIPLINIITEEIAIKEPITTL